MRYKFRDKAPDGKPRMLPLSGPEEFKRVGKQLKDLRDRYEALKFSSHEPGTVAFRLGQELDELQKKYDELAFVWQDHAAEIPLSVRLRRINQRNAEFWRTQ